MPADTPAQDRENLTVADIETLSAKEAENGSRTEREIPADAIAIVPVRQLVLFPGHGDPGDARPAALGRRRPGRGTRRAADRHPAQRDASVDEPGEIDLYRIGTVANVVRYLTGKDGSHHVVCQGEQRFRVVEFLHGWPFLVARIERLETPDADSPEIEARFINLKRQALEALELLPQVPQELVQQINAINDAGALADIVAAYLDLDARARSRRCSRRSMSPRASTSVSRYPRAADRGAAAVAGDRPADPATRSTSASASASCASRWPRSRRSSARATARRSEIAELREAIAKAEMPEEAEKQARKELHAARAHARGRAPSTA